MARVLIVEDHALSRDMLARRLRRKGFEVLSAHDGQAGVQLTRKEHPDIVLMDLNMPILDGFQATSIIKSSRQTCDIPIVALTALDMQSHRARVSAAGFDAFESKPVRLQRLLATIERLLTEHAA